MTTDTLPWLEDELRSLVGDLPPGAPHYSVSVWCGDEPRDPDDTSEPGPWGVVEVCRCRLGALRRVLAHLRSCGWAEDFSLFVRRED